METNQNLLSSELQIDPIGHSYLSETSKWANFLAIVGFVFSGLMLIVALFALSKLNEYSGYSSYGYNRGMSSGSILVIYLILSVVTFILSLFLFRFASKMKIALQSTDQEALNNSLLNLKNAYKLMGILTIIYIVIVVLAIIYIIGVASSFR